MTEHEKTLENALESSRFQWLKVYVYAVRGRWSGRWQWHFTHSRERMEFRRRNKG